MRKDNTLQIRLPTEMLEAIKEKAKEDRVSISLVVRTLLTHWLDGEEGFQVEEENDKWQ